MSESFGLFASGLLFGYQVILMPLFLLSIDPLLETYEILELLALLCVCSSIGRLLGLYLLNQRIHKRPKYALLFLLFTLFYLYSVCDSIIILTVSNSLHGFVMSFLEGHILFEKQRYIGFVIGNTSVALIVFLFFPSQESPLQSASFASYVNSINIACQCCLSIVAVAECMYNASLKSKSSTYEDELGGALIETSDTPLLCFLNRAHVAMVFSCLPISLYLPVDRGGFGVSPHTFSGILALSSFTALIIAAIQQSIFLSSEKVPYNFHGISLGAFCLCIILLRDGTKGSFLPLLLVSLLITTSLIAYLTCRTVSSIPSLPASSTRYIYLAELVGGSLSLYLLSLLFGDQGISKHNSFICAPFLVATVINAVAMLMR